MQFDVAEALRYAEAGQLEEWVHSYLTTGEWANLGLSDGLRLQPRWWVGPILVDIALLTRVVGPEDGMEFPVPADQWHTKINQMAASFTDLLEVPPLIALNRQGDLSLSDGNHRWASMRLKGWQRCWVIIWYLTEAEYLTSPYRQL